MVHSGIAQFHKDLKTDYRRNEMAENLTSESTTYLNILEQHTSKHFFSLDILVACSFRNCHIILSCNTKKFTKCVRSFSCRHFQSLKNWSATGRREGFWNVTGLKFESRSCTQSHTLIQIWMLLNVFPHKGAWVYNKTKLNTIST